MGKLREAKGFAHPHTVHPAVLHGVERFVEHVAGHVVGADHRRDPAVGLAGGMNVLRPDKVLFMLAMLPALTHPEIDPLLESDPLDLVKAPAQVAHILQPQPGQGADHLHLHDQEGVDHLAGVDIDIAQILHDQVAGGDAPGAAVMAVAVAVAADRHQRGGTPDHPISAQGNGFDHILVGADAPADDKLDMIAQPVAHQAVVDQRYGILDVHPHLPLDDVWRSAGASAGAVQPYFHLHPILAGVGGQLAGELQGIRLQILQFAFQHLLGIVLGNPCQPGGDKLDIHRGRDLHRDHRLRIDHPHHVDKRLHILDRIAVVEGEGGDHAGVDIADHFLAQAQDALRLDRIDLLAALQLVHPLLDLPQAGLQFRIDLLVVMGLAQVRMGGL